jgi:hypothetical protein
VGRTATATLAAALSERVTGGDAHRATLLAAQVDGLPPGVAAQVLALVGAAHDRADWCARARALAPWTTHPDVRREILTPAEVVSGRVA